MMTLRKPKASILYNTLEALKRCMWLCSYKLQTSTLTRLLFLMALSFLAFSLMSVLPHNFLVMRETCLLEIWSAKCPLISCFSQGCNFLRKNCTTLPAAWKICPQSILHCKLCNLPEKHWTLFPFLVYPWPHLACTSTVFLLNIHA